MRNGKLYRVLSLDGGGIRGIMTAVWLARLEKILGKQLRGYFDLIAGTSTGSILACGIATGKPASDIVGLYRNRGDIIFRRNGLMHASRWYRRFHTLFRPRYGLGGLRTELQAIFVTDDNEPLRMSDLQPKTMVLAYDAFRRNPVVFKSYVDYHSDVLVADACQASSSAPTFFPACDITLEGAVLPMIDGGVVANNPSACALDEVIALHGKSSIFTLNEETSVVLASFGPGSFTRSIRRRDARQWGAWGWMANILDVMFDGSSDAAHFICKKILPDDYYFRFQTKIDSDFSVMDNASSENINSLIAVATQYWDHDGGHDLLKALADVLTSRISPEAVEVERNPVG